MGIRYTSLSNEKFKIAGLKIQPVPAKDFLTITSDNLFEKKLEFYDVLGQLVLSFKSINESVNISELSKGVYILKITQD